MDRRGSFAYGSQDQGKRRGLQILWDGSWSSGDITVPNVRSYTMFLIYMANRVSVIPAFYNATDSTEYISGIGGRATSASAEYQYSFECTMDGNTLTMVHCHSHQGAGNRTAQTVSKIVGVF